eukprot:SAG31_NODE_2533_length_5554_cov_2.350623_6_plen_85_part_00
MDARKAAKKKGKPFSASMQPVCTYCYGKLQDGVVSSIKLKNGSLCTQLDEGIPFATDLRALSADTCALTAVAFCGWPYGRTHVT